MDIAVICDVLGEENNGTTIAAMNLIRTLRAKGHQVRVVSPDANRAGEPGYYVVPTRNLGIFNNYVAKNGVSLAKPVRSILEAALEGVDVVHVMVPFSLGHAAALISREKGIRASLSSTEAVGWLKAILFKPARIISLKQSIIPH